MSSSPPRIRIFATNTFLVAAVATSGLVSSCRTTDHSLNQTPDEVSPYTDQLAYLKELKEKRPDLFANDCKNNLIVKPKYRESILRGRTEYSKIVNEEYSSELREVDRRWANGFREAAAALKAKIGKVNRDTNFYVANYPPEKFVGYHVGRPTDYDNEGLGRKVYLEFKSVIDDLTPARYLEFSEALRTAGFNGDSKVELAPGVARFQFNNIVIHAGSSEDAEIAEKVSRHYFSGKLASMGRGVDVKRNGKGSDWSQFLCSQDTSTLPSSAFRYLTHKAVP
jgi:hypothetical protein